MKRAVFLAALVITCVSCTRASSSGRTPDPQTPGVSAAGGETPQAASPANATPAVTVPTTGAAGTTAGADAPPEIGAPKAFDNLTVFPITSKSQDDLGPIRTLDDALAKHAALVREQGADTNGRGDGAQVNSLVIENKGDIPVYVLAGTVVKGGKQDRQIGQDFIIGPKETVPVEAYCIEHGRWTTDRDGVATGGQFGTIGLLTPTEVRAAAELQQDQSRVWSKVGEVNAANRKSAASGTLLATLDSNDVAARRTALAGKVDGFLKSVQPGDAVVGLAYAVDGNVRSVRYFANHKLFEMFRPVLVNSAAMDAINAQAPSLAAGKPIAPAPPVAPATVSGFIKDAESGAQKSDRDTPAANTNEVQSSEHVYESKTMLKAPASTPHAKPKKVSASVNSF